MGGGYSECMRGIGSGWGYKEWEIGHGRREIGSEQKGRGNGWGFREWVGKVGGDRREGRNKTKRRREEMREGWKGEEREGRRSREERREGRWRRGLKRREVGSKVRKERKEGGRECKRKTSKETKGEKPN